MKDFWCKFLLISLYNRYISGSENILCQSDDENEVEVDEKVLDQEISDDNSVNNKEESRSKGEESADLLTPILSVYHENGYRTVLTAIPATFGLTIKNDTEVGTLLQIWLSFPYQLIYD